jgi:hypothetical protein
MEWERIVKESQADRAKGQAPSDDGDADYSPATTDKAPSRLHTERCKGTLIDFLDEVESIFPAMCSHRHTLERCKRSALQFERNATPKALLMDIDWAENYTIEEARMIQSQYWAQEQVSIFVTVLRWLDQACWDSDVSELKKNDEVTVRGEGLWGQVVDISEGKVRIKHEDNSEKLYARAELHHRAWKAHALIGFTPDKKHDSYATQFFLEENLKWIEANLPTQFTWLALHSDNAAQHFKCSKSLNWLSSVRANHPWMQKATWSFGCPGHGKGNLSVFFFWGGGCG